MLRTGHLAIAKPSTRRPRRLNPTPYLFVLPGLIFFAVFTIYPVVETFRISFYDWQIMPGAISPFVGADNYLRAFQDDIFWTALRNTILYAVVTVPGQMILAMLVALLLDALPRGRAVFRILYYMPVITSLVVVSLLFRFLFEASDAGLINFFLMRILHVISQPIPWMREELPALIAIWTLGIWKGIGWSMLIFLAALQSIPSELQEAAAIDGANAAQRFFRITMPLMRPTIVFVLVMLVIGGLNVFIPVYLTTGGGPLHRTETILTYMYHQSFQFLEFGYGAALSNILLVIIVVISFLQIKFFRRPAEA